MNKMKRSTVNTIVNRIVQLVFFLLAPDIYVTCFNGVKYIATQMGNAAVIEVTPFVAVMVTMLIYTFIFGRFFCGYACAFGFLGDVVYDASEAVQKKAFGKAWQIPAAARSMLMKVKYVILAAVFVLCMLGMYGKVSGYDPWEVFGSFRALDFTLTGKTAGFMVLLAIIIGMAAVRRFFCIFLCPMGAVFSLMPVIPFSVMSRKPEKCVGKCHMCEHVCPTGYFSSDDTEGLEFLGRNTGEGECICCSRCAAVCPACNAGHWKPEGRRGNEWYVVLIKAAVLFAAVKAAVALF